MKSFGKPKPRPTPIESDAMSAIRDLTERFERMERTIRDIKQNVDLVPALLRKMYLADVKLEPPYDLQAERFSFSSQNDEDGLVLALVKRIGFTNRQFVELGCGMNGGNSGFLASEMGWRGLMVDARDDAIRKIVIRFTGHDVTAKHRLLTREDVNEFITESRLRRRDRLAEHRHRWNGLLDLAGSDGLQSPAGGNRVQLAVRT